MSRYDSSLAPGIHVLLQAGRLGGPVPRCLERPSIDVRLGIHAFNSTPSRAWAKRTILARKTGIC
jgi:hypothetical protein